MSYNRDRDAGWGGGRGGNSYGNGNGGGGGDRGYQSRGNGQGGGGRGGGRGGGGGGYRGGGGGGGGYGGGGGGHGGGGGGGGGHSFGVPGGGGGGFGGGGGGGGGPPAPPPRRAAPITTTAIVEGPNGLPITEAVKRHDYGTVGRPITLTTNCFDLRIAESATEWFKYQVIVSLDLPPNRKSDRSPRVPNKKEVRAVWTEFEKTGSSTVLGGVAAAFDGHAAAFTNAILPGGGEPMVVEGLEIVYNPKTKYKIVIQNPTRIELNSLRNYIANNGRAQFGDVGDALSALNTVLHHGPAALFPATRMSFFVSKEAETAFDDPRVRKEAQVLAGGIELLRGFFQSVRTCRMGLQLNLDTTSSAFIAPGSLIDFILAFLSHAAGLRGNGPRALEVGRLNPRDIIRVNRALKGLEIIVDRGASMRPLKRKMRGRGLLDMKPYQHKFDASGVPTDVERYIENQFQVKLQNPHLPCVEISNGTLYPLEMISIREGNKWAKKLTPTQQGTASTFQILKPPARMGLVMATREHILTPISGPHLTEFGISLSPVPKTINGRILPPPTIEYLDPRRPPPNAPPQTVAVQPSQGAWQMRFARGEFDQKFMKGADIASLAIIVSDQRDVQAITNFLTILLGNCNKLGMVIADSVPNPLPHSLVHVRRPNESPASAVDAAVIKCEQHMKALPQVVFWLFRVAKSPDYASFKLRCTELGLGSQALQDKLMRKTNDVQTQINIAMKINLKTHGFCFRLKVHTTGGFLERCQPMIFGADLTHELDKPSVVAMVGSMHAPAILYEEVLTVQRLIEPPEAAPEGTRAKKSEVIESTRDNALLLLRRRVIALGKAPPDELVFYRDGVSESEFAAVIEVEVPAFKAACEDLKADKWAIEAVGAEALQNWKPKLTYIACLKRHHVRAFEDKGGGRVDNVQPGTIFDEGVTDARSFDWYSASHKGILGTTKPTRYVVLVDEHTPQLTADELQTLTASLTHSYQRCNLAVSIPAPVYYADLLARRVHPWVLQEDDALSQTGTSSSGTPQSRAADFEAATAVLKSTERGRHAFRGQRGGLPPAMWWC